MTVRVRFAPSPTGMLHVGGARTALYDHLVAEKYDGVFLIRIEDTDSKRYNPAAVTNIYESLEYLGMLPDEGPNGEELLSLGVDSRNAVKWGIGGEYGPYTQSRRKEIYHTEALRLVERGYAYYVFSDDLDSKETDEKFSVLSKEMGLNEWREAPEYIWREKLLTGEKHHIRLKLPRHGTIECSDQLRGKVVFKCNKLKDPVIIKSDGMATYHLANVVDDHLMNISHVLRGEEWLSSYPIHHYLYQVFNWQAPIFFHLPVILNPVGQGKMSKRAIQVGDVTIPTFVTDYKKLGYMPEAMVNYMSLLGWGTGDDREYFNKEELIKAFDPYNIGKTGARWDIRKLQRMNQHYIKNLEPSVVARRYFTYGIN